MAKKKPTYEGDLKASLRDDRYAAEYLNAAMRDEEPVFLLALRNVVEAHRVSRVARKAKLNRESLYRTLSPAGNPTLRTLASVLDALGLQLSVAAKTAVATQEQPQLPDTRQPEDRCQFAASCPTRQGRSSFVTVIGKTIQFESVSGDVGSFDRTFIELKPAESAFPVWVDPRAQAQTTSNSYPA